MVTQVKAPQIYLPTGYESLQAQADQKRRLAERLMSDGMSAQPDMNSYVQVLGKLAETLVGRLNEKKADKLDLQIKNQMGEDYRNKSGQFYTDTQSMKPGELVAKYSADPMMADMLDPYKDAYAQSLKEAEGHRIFGGQWVRQGNIQEGSYDNKPTDKVIGVNGPEGPTWQINPTAVTASIASQGLGVDNGQTSMPAPGNPNYRSGENLPQSQAPIQSDNSSAILSGDAWLGAVNGLGRQGAADWIRRNPSIKVRVNSPADVARLGLPSGTRIINSNGDELEVP